MVARSETGSEVSTHEVLHQAAAAFAAEFARLGYSTPRLMELFADPFYAPAYIALRRLGEPAVRHIVAEAVRARPALPRPVG
jgi:hypothetical protein